MDSMDSARFQKKTILGRVFALWAIAFFITIFLVARPTGYTWPFWIYGLVWGVITSVVHFLFRGFFEKKIEIRQGDLP